MPPFELLLATCVGLFFWLILKPGWLRPLLSILPMIGFYQAYPRFHTAFGRTFRLSDISELPELLHVLPTPTLLIAGAVALFLTAIYILHLNRSLRMGLIVATVLAASLVGAVEFAPDQYLALTHPLMRKISPWSEWKTAEESGYLATTLYAEARRKNAQQKLLSSHYAVMANTNQQTFLRQLKTRTHLPNIHLIILESFLDPSLFKDLEFSRPPISRRLQRIMGDQGSIVISPVFGGNTAQAEFEALCGAPALAHFSSIEFNLFSGSNARCLPDTLRESGYLTIASNAFRPDFFNEETAYRGLGFSEINFPKQYYSGKTYLSNNSDNYFMFDSDLYSQNLDHLRQQLKRGRPVFNYVLGIYGHHPHTLGNQRKPLVELRPKRNQPAGPLLRNAVTQALYRTRALASYLEQLIELDPESIIIVFGDHLPVLDGGVTTYHQFNYLGNGAYRRVRGYIIEKGTPHRYTDIHEYEIPQLILSFVLNQPYRPATTASTDDKHREQEYLSVMANAIR